MEDVLEACQRPYDEKRPVLCIDETNRQLIGEAREPLPAAQGRPALHDYEYVRNGAANLFAAFEPQEAHRLCQRFEIHYTPRRGSRLNMAELEIGGSQPAMLEPEDSGY